MFSVILATDNQGGIGKERCIPWFNGEDLRMFKRKTQNNVVIMGKGTWESLPVRPLPKRMNIILSKTLHQNDDENVKICSSLADCIRYLKTYQSDKEWFIIGGGQLYNQIFNMEPLIDKVYLTQVHHNFECDVKVDLSCLTHRKSKTEKEINFKLSEKSKYDWVYSEYNF